MGSGDVCNDAPKHGDAVPSFRLDGSGPIVLSVIASLGAAAGSSLIGYIVYQVASNPPRIQNPGIRYTARFQILGIVSLVVPVAALTAFLVVAGVLLLRYRLEVSEGPNARLLSTAGRQWVARAVTATTGGYLVAVVVVAVAAVADQTYGGPRSVSTIAGGAVSFLAFVVGWGLARFVLKAPLRVGLPRGLLVLTVTGGFIAAAAFTRIQDEQNLSLFQRAPISAGFYDLSAAAVPVVRAMLVTCADPSDCVATGFGNYPGPDPWQDWAMLGTSTDGGAHWQVAVLPSSVENTTRATCSENTCRLALLPADNHVVTNGNPVPVTVSFTSDGGTRISEGRSEVWPSGEVPPLCTDNHCLVFAPPHSGMAAGLAAWYSDNGGATWTSSVFAKSEGRSGRAALRLGGPWCVNSRLCGAVSIADSNACYDGNANGCTHQLTIWQTDDGGETWSTTTLPVDRPAVASVNCLPGGTCTGLFAGNGSAGGRFVLSGNWGLTWTATRDLPVGATNLYCWSIAGCVAEDDLGVMLTSADGGRTWQRQVIVSSPDVYGIPMWCSTTGRCVADGWDTSLRESVLTRASPNSPWLVHHFSQPRPISLGA